MADLPNRDVPAAPEISLPGWTLPLSCYDTDVSFYGNDLGRGTPELANAQFQPAIPEGHRIIDEARRWFQLRRTVLEIFMIHGMNEITDKRGWIEKLQNPTIRQRWVREAKNMLASADTRYSVEAPDMRNGPFYWGEAIEEQAVQFMFEELQGKARSGSQYVTVLGLGGADIVKSNVCVPEIYRSRLIMCLSELEDGPVDWHPGREQAVRNLVHPSLYPLQFGKTRVVAEKIPLRDSTMYAGHGQTLPEQKPSEHYSQHFQWLPAEVSWDGSKVVFESYINNLHPRHTEIYSALGELVGYAIPLWNMCMATNTEQAPRRVPCNYEELLWRCEEFTGELPPYTEADRPMTAEEAWKELYNDGARKWGYDTYTLLSWRPVLEWPELEETYDEFRSQLPERSLDLFSTLQEQGLQVIVKVSSIHLTPENPRFSGGSLHVEGLANEHICATAIYYYDSENIETSFVHFWGGAIMGGCVYNQDDYRCLEYVYGTGLKDDPAIQRYAAVKTPQGRLLAFPNVFKHRVLPFSLRDRSKPGHRKMVVLWLVNPQKRIISTAHVPPQQKWAWDEAVASHVQGKVPVEIRDMISAANPDIMSPEDAHEVRLRLMEERRVERRDYGAIERQYDFCEH